MGSTNKKQREKALLSNAQRQSNRRVSVRRRPEFVIVQPEIQKLSLFTALIKWLKEIKKRIWR